MRRKYGDCRRQDGNCTLCSLVNYGRDCHNRPISKLEWARLGAGMSQRELAEASGVKARQIQPWRLNQSNRCPTGDTGRKEFAMSISRNIAYGVSSKYEFGAWNHHVVGPFTSEDEAQKWLHQEEYDFRERELMSKTAAIRLIGRREFDRQTAIEED